MSWQERIPELAVLVGLTVTFLRHLSTRDKYTQELHARSLDVIDKNTQAWAEVKEALTRNQ